MEPIDGTGNTTGTVTDTQDQEGQLLYYDELMMGC